MSTKKERLEGYLSAGDIRACLLPRSVAITVLTRTRAPELTSDDIRDIDLAGAIGVRALTLRAVARRAAGLAVVAAAALGVCAYLGIDVL
jgi:hypothetical protein